MSSNKVGYTQEAGREYKRRKPWTMSGLDLTRLGEIKKDMPSKPGTAMVQWDGSNTPQQVSLDCLEER